jgi:hypothetical protein
VYVEAAITPAERERLQLAYSGALDELRGALGPQRSPRPVVIFCKSEPCQVYFSGSARRSCVRAPGERLEGAGYVPTDRLTVVVNRIDGHARGFLLHELVHVELLARQSGGFVPAWFHEGVAASIADEPQCRPGPGHGMMRGIDDLRRLDHPRDWFEFTNLPGTIHATYCQARAEVEAKARRVGRDRLLALVEEVRDDASFYPRYGPMQTQDSGAVPTVLVSSASELADRRKAFSLAMWIRPAEDAGVLAHVSSTDAGTGWCTPFLGFDDAHRLVSQVLHGNGPEPFNYAVAAVPAPLPVGRWAHVAMTWAPGGFNRLYVNGVQAAATAAPDYASAGAGRSMYVTWGSHNRGGTACWPGAVSGDAFKGPITGMHVYDTELSATELARLAATPP